jgi:hypothetical protein
MATGTLGTTARDYPSRGERICYNITFTNFGAGTSVKVGTVPAGSALLRCYTVTGTAFNSSTTNNISVGNAAAGAQIVAANAIGAAGINTQTIIAALAGPLAADTPVWITGTFAAAAPTAGNADFVLEWANPGGA